MSGAKIRWKKFSQRKNKQRQACMQIVDNLVMFLSEGCGGGEAREGVRVSGCRGVRRLGT